MGTLRINSTLLDLKYHPASSTLQVTDQDVESLGSVPHFALSKWASKGGSRKGKDFSTDTDSEIGSPLSPQLRHRGVSGKKRLICWLFSALCLSVFHHLLLYVIR
jgi:hypothetical protein